MKNHLQFSWWKYLLVLLIPAVIWSSVFKALAEPKPDERVGVLYVGQSLNAALLQQQLTDALPELSDQPLLEVTVTQTEIPELSYRNVLVSRTFEYDIMIIEESSLQPGGNQMIFGTLPDALQESFPGGIFYTEDAGEGEMLPVGMILDPGVKTRFSACYTGDQRCYLFFSPESVNFDTRNGNGNPGNDAALQATYYLLERTP